MEGTSATPALTRWFIKSALAYFVAALLLGVALAMPAVFALPPALAVLSPVYWHLFIVGWVTQLIFGVVYWMFPRYSKEQPRGNESLAQATYGFLNLGLILRAIVEPLYTLQPDLMGDGWWRCRPRYNGWQEWCLCSIHGHGSRSGTMPRLSRWFIRASLLYLSVGFTFGAWLLFRKGVWSKYPNALCSRQLQTSLGQVQPSRPAITVHVKQNSSSRSATASAYSRSRRTRWSLASVKTERLADVLCC